MKHNMTHKNAFLVLFFLIEVASFGQKYGNIWQFGNQIGLDFNSCEPEVITGANIGFEGCAAISDSTGQLLFYTNSDKVWDKEHNVMPNGIINNTSGTLSQVIIIPKPLSSNIYYIITTKPQAAMDNLLSYHVIDRTLNGGLGDVQSSDNVMSNLIIAEQIAATYHSNGTDIWLMAHEYETSKFLAFLVNGNGISNDPVISDIGPAHQNCSSNINARGEIKFSPDGTRLVMNANGIGTGGPQGVNVTTSFLALFDFDNNTGVVSNPINLPFSRGEYGVSFSPDNSKLYGTTWKSFGFSMQDYNYLYQFDLTSNNPQQIIDSKQIIDSMLVPTSYGTLKIGPNGKIYVRYISENYLGVIQFPNLTGEQCGYQRNGLYLGEISDVFQYGLNHYIEYQDYCDSHVYVMDSLPQPKLYIYPNPLTSQSKLISNVPLSDATLNIFSCQGDLVLQIRNVNQHLVEINRDHLNNGLYFLTVEENDEIIYREKLVVE